MAASARAAAQKDHEKYARNEKLIWAPQEGAQTAFVHCPIEEIAYGGSRGGGKTDAQLGRLAIRSEIYGQDLKALLIRRELPQLEAVIARSKEIFGPLGAEYVESKKKWTFRSGGTCVLRHFAEEDDVEKTQGWSLTDVCIEEGTNFPNFLSLLKLKATLRSTKGVPSSFCVTMNPGGPGHTILKKRYIDPAPMGWKVIEDRDKFTNSVSRRIYIPSRVFDNKLLLDNDPGYIARLAQSGSEALVKAWLYGDWNIVDGAFFDFDINRHVIKQQQLPEHWTRIRGGDWGSAKPFAFGWAAIASEPFITKCGKLIPKGAIVIEREWYGVKIDGNGEFVPNEGVRLYAEAVGQGIAELEANMPKVSVGVLDPSAFAQDGGPSIAERIFRGSGNKVLFRRADNKRVPGRGAMGGWDAVRGRLAGEDILGTGELTPTLFLMESCIHGIRTLPALQHDRLNPEDLDTDGEDHWADMLRYICLSRPHVSPTRDRSGKLKGIESVRMSDLWAQREAESAESQRPRRI
jgi:hypothetical protein